MIKLLNLLRGLIPSFLPAFLKAIGNLVKPIWNWFWFPIPFTLGPLLLILYFCVRTCEQRRASSSGRVGMLEDSIISLHSDLIFLQDDTSYANRQIKVFQTQIKALKDDSISNRRFLLSLPDDALQGEIDRAYNFPAIGQYRFDSADSGTSEGSGSGYADARRRIKGAGKHLPDKKLRERSNPP